MSIGIQLRPSASHRGVQVDVAELRLNGFFGGQDCAALVLAAFAAGAVGQLALVAVGALGEAGGGEEVVAAALGSPLLGVAPFWIRHCSIPFEVFNLPMARGAGSGIEAKLGDACC
jgi:hypothetical protein